MSEEQIHHRPAAWVALLLGFLILIQGRIIVGDSLDSDKQVLLSLRSFLVERNSINQGRYNQWDPQAASPCGWPGISCTGGRVTGVDLSNNLIAWDIFGNFSALTELTHLDLSQNTISGPIPDDLSRCRNLRFLNLSRNLIPGELNLSGLSSLEILDLSVNRIGGNIQLSFPQICSNLVVANLSGNGFTGAIGNSLDECGKLQYVDLSSNNLTGNILFGFYRFKEFSVSENFFASNLPEWIFPENCSLRVLDLAENNFTGELPINISNCKDLVVLNLWGNSFGGKIPPELGSLANLNSLLLGNNSFLREIPISLTGLRNLAFLDLSRNNFGGDIQETFGQFTQVKYLLLHANSYTGGLYTSGILRLPNIVRLDLSFNNFSGQLPIGISQLPTLKYLFLAYNHFTGSIPSEYGDLLGLQALDLSFNNLNGSIPPTFGQLTSLLWLMLANNSLTGEIPPELGNCSSLLWLNLANNRLSGPFPPQLTGIANNATPTFLLNRQSDRQSETSAGSGECSAMKRWIPADYPPFSFVYTLLTRKSCRDLWKKILRGYGIFPVCYDGSEARTFQISGYIQLGGNQLSGQLPPDIRKMKNFSMLQLGINDFSGTLPAEVGEMPLVVLNVSRNRFSGDVPMQLGSLVCLRNLDLSYNNFSGAFPTSLNNLTELSKFNISYNPYISGVIPGTGQLATFENLSFLGDPLLILPNFINNATNRSSADSKKPGKPPNKFLVFIALLLAFFGCGVMTIVVCLLIKSPVDQPGYLLQEIKIGNGYALSSGGSSPWLSDTVKVIRLDKTAFTHADILKATGNFAVDRIVGRGGYGTVYRGVLPDGREVAVKRKLREGSEGEREFRAEMEVLTGNGFGWPHPNLVTLYGWSLDGSEKLLVYEYMEGGSLEDHIPDRTRFTWKRRVNVAIDVARALVFLHHECYPSIVHRDVKASNVLLDRNGKARVTDFGLARVVDVGDSHVSTMVAGTVGYVAPEYGQTWQATTKGDVYSYGVLVMELATARRAVDGGEESLVEWARRVMGNGRQGFTRAMIPVSLLVSGLGDGAEEMCELLRIGIKCTAEAPQARPNMKEVLDALIGISRGRGNFSHGSSPPPL